MKELIPVASTLLGNGRVQESQKLNGKLYATSGRIELGQIEFTHQGKKYIADRADVVINAHGVYPAEKAAERNVQKAASLATMFNNLTPEQQKIAADLLAKVRK